MNETQQAGKTSATSGFCVEEGDQRRRKGCIMQEITENQSQPALGRAERELDTYIADAVNASGVPGVAVAVVKDDAVLFARGYGRRALDSAMAVTEQTMFEIGSLTKAFTATAVAMLVDEGRLHWDDPLTRYLPDLQFPDPYVTRAMTLRDVLMHRSGLDVPLLSDLGCSRTEGLRRLRYPEQGTAFRNKYMYQNINYILAGEVVAAVSGQSWEQFVQERIFIPLGMSDTLPSQKTLPPGANVATAHAPIGGTMQAIPLSDLDADAAAGAMLSSAADMAQWLRLHLNRGMHNQLQLLSPERVREMHKLQIIFPEDNSAQGSLYALAHEPRYAGYGFGWRVREYLGRSLVAHVGGTYGMSTSAAMIPEERLGVVVLANADVGQWHLWWPNALVLRVLDSYLGAPSRDWNAEYRTLARERQAAAEAAPTIEATQVQATTPSLPLLAYAGVYENGLYGAAQVVHSDGQLSLHISPVLSGPLSHWHYDTFRATWANSLLPRARVTFTLDKDGQVDTMAVHDIQPSPIFNRRGATPQAAA
jgi:CubicO group peptidase (beta-lactamase class C family)